MVALVRQRRSCEAKLISKSYVSRILRLALLVLDIVEAILAGRPDEDMMLERLERPLPASWEEQRARIGKPKKCKPSDVASPVR